MSGTHSFAAENANRNRELVLKRGEALDNARAKRWP